uniref:Secreted protein n=1 Tax=Triticum urartu TaxID=4572 RepID=A0A8R7PHQ0_TRIUA
MLWAALTVLVSTPSAQSSAASEGNSVVFSSMSLTLDCGFLRLSARSGSMPSSNMDWMSSSLNR